MTGLLEIALLRLAAQRLVGPPAESPLAAVRWLTAAQAQDPAGVLTSVALRTRSGTRAGIHEAMSAGDVVKSWPMRGTLHLVASEDLPWMLQVLAPRVVAGTVGRRTGLGLDESTLERGRELTVEALGDGRRLRRADLLAHWDGAGLSTAGQRGAHLLSYLAMTGTIVFGPVVDGQQALVLVDEWIAAPRQLQQDEALGELALRYFRSHGPAAATDLARWAHLTAADVRIALALARPGLTVIDVGGTEHLMDPQTPDRLAAAREQAEGVLLLPGFDELMLGYADRSAQLDAAYADRIVPGGNGVFRPTVVSAGRVVGTWARTGRGAQQSVAATPFTSFPPAVAAAVPRLSAALP